MISSTETRIQELEQLALRIAVRFHHSHGHRGDLQNCPTSECSKLRALLHDAHIKTT